MKRGDAARRFPIRALAPGLVALCACSGCIAFNVGSPERFTSEFPAGVETRTPEKNPTPRAIIANIAINLGSVSLMDLKIVFT